MLDSIRLAGFDHQLLLSGDRLLVISQAPPLGHKQRDADVTVLTEVDVSDPTAPDAEKFIDLPCGSHTASGVPDPANDRLIIYSTPSSGA